MSYKTPQHIVFEELKKWTTNHPPTVDDASAEYLEACKRVADAVIAHVTPAIKAKARSEAIADALDKTKAAAAEADATAEESFKAFASDEGYGCAAAELGKLCDEIRALAAAPAGHVVASADDLNAIMNDVRAYGHNKTNLEILADRARPK
jgi:hypothetical protein